MPPSGKVKIRRARADDVENIADLSGQLGYPTPPKTMSKRLKGVLAAADSACFVAAAPGQGVIGWIHVSVTPLLEVERRAEVNGLVVDELTRGGGAGGLLLQAAEKWAKRQRCVAMSVRSNVLRERAHEFYLRHGFEHYKTQKAFRKPL
jgi:GNAT superfamily N-acetyltransferase